MTPTWGESPDHSTSSTRGKVKASPGPIGAQNSPCPAAIRSEVVERLSVAAQKPDHPTDAVTPAYAGFPADSVVVYAEKNGRPPSDERPPEPEPIVYSAPLGKRARTGWKLVWPGCGLLISAAGGEKTLGADSPNAPDPEWAETVRLALAASGSAASSVCTAQSGAVAL